MKTRPYFLIALHNPSGLGCRHLPKEIYTRYFDMEEGFVPEEKKPDPRSYRDKELAAVESLIKALKPALEDIQKQHKEAKLPDENAKIIVLMDHNFGFTGSKVFSTRFVQHEVERLLAKLNFKSQIEIATIGNPISTYEKMNANYEALSKNPLIDLETNTAKSTKYSTVREANLGFIKSYIDDFSPKARKKTPKPMVVDIVSPTADRKSPFITSPASSESETPSSQSSSSMGSPMSISMFSPSSSPLASPITPETKTKPKPR